MSKRESIHMWTTETADSCDPIVVENRFFFSNHVDSVYNKFRVYIGPDLSESGRSSNYKMKERTLIFATTIEKHMVL